MIIGVGNRLRSDDGAGREAAARLAARFPAAPIRQLSGEMTELMEAWEGVDSVILIDALQSGQAPGTIHQLEAGDEPLPAFFRQTSTHGFGLAEAIELSRTFDSLPALVRVFGIEATDFSAGEGLSPAVEEAVGEVVEALARELENNCSEEF